MTPDTLYVFDDAHPFAPFLVFFKIHFCPKLCDRIFWIEMGYTVSCLIYYNMSMYLKPRISTSAARVISFNPIMQPIYGIHSGSSSDISWLHVHGCCSYYLFVISIRDTDWHDGSITIASDADFTQTCFVRQLKKLKRKCG